ncbi:N,N-dimethylformamidase beta subunit family domain-containing protein [Fischerella sp. PCC 9605]|uniref:N,N-dimethylformamidase beta subunit family domain-containing protein n=1 Tax=Fischerella sp. PCC 9605 TaxID=1173024 RepID=UPI00047CFFED|nr:N,N-dimethylformamidase beta subunit family domain-containing protein [Fischerella sp. PCC 9605]
MRKLIRLMIVILFTALLAINLNGGFQLGTRRVLAVTNPIVTENSLPGNPPSEWDISGAGSSNIQGFTTDISYNLGETVNFKINTNSTNYRLDIYRMGYYGGNGARKVDTVLPSVPLPQNQPNCLTNSSTGLIDCGNWAVSASWQIPTTATSGIYFAKAVRQDGTTGASHIVFIVRNDSSNSDLLFQTSDTTWLAYNSYGGNSLYTGSPVGRAYKVSYNRPFNTRSVDGGADWLFNAEYPMVRWLEANGYDVSYFTGVDSDRRGDLIKNHKVFLSVGHDEYWSNQQRQKVEAARDAGINLAFFSGNEVFWKTRWENSIDGSGTPYRTLVCYKETHANAIIDPEDPPTWTGTWRDPRFSPPADGGRPENALTGTLFTVNAGATTAIQVPAADGQMRLWRNTSIANLLPGSTATLTNGTLGYEWDEDIDNGLRPPGLIRMSTTTVNNAPVLQDYGSTFRSGTATHHLTLYKYSGSTGNSALVFGSGTVQWPWGLDGNHDRGTTTPDVRMQQATVNLFADMGVQPATLQSGLQLATASGDTTAPTSTITSPTAGATVQAGTQITISGAASDIGGVVGGVEVSVDGGATWHPANGRASWSYIWLTPTTNGTVTIKSRAIDDSGNIETPGNEVNVTVSSNDTTPPTVTSATPSNGATNVSTGTTVKATFSEAMDAATISTSNFELRDPNNTLVTGTVTYDAASNTATLTPSSTLAISTTYTATIKGGTTGVKDQAGNALAQNYTWSFTTTNTSSVSIWDDSATPALITENDSSAVNLGVKFRSDVNGNITGIRFYKGPQNTGTHVGVLWTSSGQELARATFTNETASGWQQVNFATPVAITANTVYVASYHTTVGRYSQDVGYFANSGVDKPPLHALRNGESGPNGVYTYSATPAFPTSTYQSANYWVDVVFNTSN